MSAPACTSRSTTSVWPFWLAAYSGLAPCCRKTQKKVPILKDSFSSSHLILVVDSSSCIQQSLNSLHMSLCSSYLQRNTTMLYESMSEKRREKTCIVKRNTKHQSHNTEEIPVCTCMLSSFCSYSLHIFMCTCIVGSTQCSWCMVYDNSAVAAIYYN